MMTERLQASPEFQKENVRFAVKMAQDPSSQVWHDAAEVEFTIFKDAKYVGDRDQLEGEYEEYDRVSTMVALYDNDKPIGALRIIDYNPEVGFKTTNDAQAGLLDINDKGREVLGDVGADKMFELGTIGLNPEYRSRRSEGHTAKQLYAVLLARAVDQQKPYILGSVDEGYLAGFERMFGEGITHLGEAREYMGSPTVCVLIDLNAKIKSLESDGYEASLQLGHSVERDD